MAWESLYTDALMVHGSSGAESIYQARQQYEVEHQQEDSRPQGDSC
jgi:hypothetical protein